jgi:hypothetical protein
VAAPYPRERGESVERYRAWARDLWRRRVWSRFSENERHDPLWCPCLVCADGREVMGYPALIPEEARQWFRLDPDTGLEWP